MVADGKIRRINIDAGGLEIFVERQCLINLAGEVQPDVVVQAAVIGIERAAHPLILRAGRLFLVIVAVVHLHRDDIFLAAEVHEFGQVEATGGNAIFVFAGELAVDPEAPGLFQAFKFEENFPVPGAGRQLEMLPVPGNARVGVPVATAMTDDVGVRIGVVERVRGADGDPFRVVEINFFRVGRVLADEFPSGVEVECDPRRRGRGVGCFRCRERQGDGQAEQNGGRGRFFHG